jgi:RNA polymerase sigma-70 factor, ECF subfamily
MGWSRAFQGEGSAEGSSVAVDQRRSFEDFFRLERDRLFGALVLVTGDPQEAEDLAQDAFVSVWERWDRLNGIENPAGYLHRTAINAFRKRYRRREVFRRLLPFLAPAEASWPADSRLVLSEALRSLTPRQRAALVLTELFGYRATEAARMLGIRPSTVGALRHQGREALRRDSEISDD